MTASAFRRALRRLADSAGPGDADRLVAVRARARAVQVRRRAAVAGTLTVAVVGGVLAGTLPSARQRDSLVATTPSPTDVLTASPTPSASPSAGRSESAPTTAPPFLGGTATPTPVGPTVTLRLVGPAVTGQEAVFEAHVVDPFGSIAGYAVSFGVADPAKPSEHLRYFSGGGELNGGGEVDAEANNCPAKEPLSAPTDTTLRFPHRFRVPGTYTAAIRVQTRSCAGVAGGYILGIELHGTPVATDTLRYSVTGSLWPQGPAVPDAELTFRRDHWSSPDVRYFDDGPGVQVRARDDAPVRSITVDWGDGSATESVAFEAEERSFSVYNDCARPVEFYPADNTVVARPDHTYTAAGRYTVTVTVVSAGCDGSDEQTKTVSGDWEWPPPTESPPP